MNRKERHVCTLSLSPQLPTYPPSHLAPTWRNHRMKRSTIGKSLFSQPPAHAAPAAFISTMTLPRLGVLLPAVARSPAPGRPAATQAR